MKALTPNIKKIAANTGWLFADKILRMGVGVVVWIWIARYLGPADFGLLNYAIAFVTLLSPLAVLGLDYLIVKDIIEEKNQNTALGTAFGMRITGSMLAFIISLVVIVFLRPGDTAMLWMVGIISFTTFFQAFDVIDFWFQSLLRSKFTVIAKNSAFLLASGIRVYLIFIKAPLITFAWIILIEAALSAIGLIIFYGFKKNSIFHWQISFTKMKSLLKNTALITLSSSAIFIYLKIDILFLGQMKGAQSAGIYSAATKVSEVFYFVANVIASSVYPVMIGNSEIFNVRLRKLFDIITAAAYLVILPVTFLAPFIISFFGSKYTASASILSVHIWATIFVFFTYAQNAWYLQGGSKGLILQLKRTATGAVINIVLNILLIPQFDGLGAAIATIISYAYVGYFSNLFNKESLNIFNMQTRSLLLMNFYGRKHPA